jgi:hypothetical protein
VNRENRSHHPHRCTILRLRCLRQTKRGGLRLRKFGCGYFVNRLTSLPRFGAGSNPQWLPKRFNAQLLGTARLVNDRSFRIMLIGEHAGNGTPCLPFVNAPSLSIQ